MVRLFGYFALEKARIKCTRVMFHSPPVTVSLLLLAGVPLICLNYLVHKSPETAFPWNATHQVQDVFEPNCKCRNRSFDVILVSPGGSGSSSGFRYFTNHLGIRASRLNHPGDKDGLKHLSFPTLRKQMYLCKLSAKAIVYQFGDPVDSVFSLYRRGYAEGHFRKLEPPFRTEHCAVDLLKNVTNYASQSNDLLGLERHIQSYLIGSLDSSCPVIFLRSATRMNPRVIELLSNILEELSVTTSTVYSEDTEESSQNRYIRENEYSTMAITYAALRQRLSELGALTLAYRGELSSFQPATVQK